MLSSRLRSALLGLVLFLLGSILIFLGVARERDGLLGAGVGSLALSGAVLALGYWFSRKDPDALNRRREQRLWKSGPLGRKWLKNRRRIP